MRQVSGREESRVSPGFLLGLLSRQHVQGRTSLRDSYEGSWGPYTTPSLEMLHNDKEAFLGHISWTQFAVALRTLY